MAEPGRGSTAHVLVGLPVELWAMIAGRCADDRSALIALAGVCHTLQGIVAQLTTGKIERTRALIDAVVDAWERLSTDANRAWAAGIDCGRCAEPHDDDLGGGGTPAPTLPRANVGKCTHLVRRYVVDQLGSDWMLCDDCAAEAIQRLHECGLGQAAPVVVQRVGLEKRHIWRTFHNFVPSHLVDGGHFALPAGLAHCVNEKAAARLAALTTLPPTHYFDDESTRLLPLPSARSWLPVGPAHAEHAHGTQYRGLFVCCDKTHPMWGVVAAACVGARGLVFNDWWIAYPHMGALMADYREQRKAMRRADIISWVTSVAFDQDDAEAEIIR
ncbi:hypothetical protein TW95_gp0022 [Pandoravirus inopinatum]|uniref:Uncharacterized protein n=1 Tax=Pandoravirus inopinatum TaxID=1605721 RepID=A0A0B5J7N3_9VIRU|nr:hypothetical protein TW95_gp0022 [Pandoravirus inopinatum]AJF96756.1 hypothetical protein [Pandoravirus inopinatum]